MVDERHYYLISSPTRFVELQRVGRRWFRYEVDAKLYPEQIRVADMLACAGGAYRRCDPSEWSAVEALAG